MDSPQNSILNILGNNDDMNFALVINDKPVLYKSRQVYVKSHRSQLVAAYYEKPKNSTIVKEYVVDLSEEWRELLECTKFCKFDFYEYMEIDGLNFTVKVNRSFKIIFIESPAMTFIKDCIKNLAGRSINTLNVSGVPYKFWESFVESWVDILGRFQVDSALSYIQLVSVTMRRKIDNKLFGDRNRLFRRTIDGTKLNFLHLFLRTTGLYNPFLDDLSLTLPVKDSWFSTSGDNDRLYARSGQGYVLYCMTVNDFCRSIGLQVKLGFTQGTALLFLFGMLYSGNANHIQIPAKHMTGFLLTKADGTSNIFTDVPNLAEGHVTPLSGLSAFALQYNKSLGGGVLNPREIHAILENEPYLDRR